MRGDKENIRNRIFSISTSCTCRLCDVKSLIRRLDARAFVTSKTFKLIKQLFVIKIIANEVKNYLVDLWKRKFISQLEQERYSKI